MNKNERQTLRARRGDVRDAHQHPYGLWKLSRALIAIALAQAKAEAEAEAEHEKQVKEDPKRAA